MERRFRSGILAMAIGLAACSGSNQDGKIVESRLEKDAPSASEISKDGIKLDYRPGEKISLKIALQDGAGIDSVIYMLNDRIIGVVSGNSTLSHVFGKEKYGNKTIRAEIFGNGKKTESSLTIRLLSAKAPQILKYEIVNTFPHDIKAYTQGLEFYGGKLVESTGNGEGPTGNKGKSSVRIVDPKTGIVSKIIELDDRIFGEGATVMNGKIYQLTYKDNLAHVYDVNTLKELQTLPYFQLMEGWGITNDGKFLYMSDGSDKIYLLDPSTFSKVDQIQVTSDRGTVPAANEMEWVNGKIYANFYTQNFVGVIDPKNGALEGVVDLSDLRNKVKKHTDLDVLNGIAYNKETKTFFVTGKNWDKMFEIKIFDWQ